MSPGKKKKKKKSGRVKDLKCETLQENSFCALLDASCSWGLFLDLAKVPGIHYHLLFLQAAFPDIKILRLLVVSDKCLRLAAF